MRSGWKSRGDLLGVGNRFRSRLNLEVENEVRENLRCEAIERLQGDPSEMKLIQKEARYEL